MEISLNEILNIETILGKGEIAHYEQFLFLSQWFQKSSAADVWKCVCMWKRVCYLCLNDLTLYLTCHFQLSRKRLDHFQIMVTFRQNQQYFMILQLSYSKTL